MATIDLTGVWHQEVQRITNQYAPGHGMQPDAVVPITTIKHEPVDAGTGSKLSPPPGNLKLPQVPAQQEV